MSVDDSGWSGPKTPSAAAPPAPPSPVPASAADTPVVVPVRHVGRWVAAAVVVVLAVMLVHSLFFSTVVRGGKRQERFEWHVVNHYFFSSQILDGLRVTIEVTVLAMVGGVILGVVLAVMRLSPNPLVTGAAWAYIWFFRGTPVLVQLLFWYNAAYIFPSFTLGVPFGPAFVHIDLNSTLTPLIVASFGLALNEGAYMAEIVRAGIISVDEGQTEAAQSIGMSRLATLRLIVLPQAMRVIIPPTGNETISMLKTSSLAFVVTLPELLFKTQEIYSATYQTVPLLMVASLWYLLVTSVLMIGQYYVERYFGRGRARQLPPTPFQRLKNAFRSHSTGPFGRSTTVDPSEIPVLGQYQR
jgi:polar amino acid transport system permease protein